MRKPKGVARGGFVRTGLVVAVGLMLSLPPAAVAGLNWQFMGKERGVEIYQARTGSGTIRVAFKNLNGHAVRVDVDEALIWCGSSIAGQGERQQTYINEFSLDPGQRYASPGWNHYSCDRSSYNLQLRGVKVFRR